MSTQTTQSRKKTTIANIWVPAPEVQAWLKQKFAYEPDTGIIREASTGESKGFLKGSHKDEPYYGVALFNPSFSLNKQITAHRLAWFLHHGEWPMFQIDHKDRNRLNNRIDNLRPATYKQNSTNCAKRQTKDNGKPTVNPYKGAYWSSKIKSWYSSIRADGKTFWLGKFETPEEAAQAYEKAATELHGEYASGWSSEVHQVDESCPLCGK